ncbi:hypothetical protein [Pyrobaculum ferrireducens]|uniref:Uncharacterized protein n=1 Tax=Pyrobaculum ferrireducens TaxID=1104324 RepID=G7VBA8_9CREN|nr:hypothetical protein [Pyrobaculum ferrireducens]AET33605.1 hypothetical protein P186_2213 [Pyrobaculum ferrireducens]
MALSVAWIRREGVDLCEGQVLARCCIGEICADVPIGADVAPGVYPLEEAAKSPSLRICVEVLNRQKEKGLRRIEVCRQRESEKCAKKLAEQILLKYGGPILLVGFSDGVANTLLSFTNGAVADAEGRLHPYEFVDVTNPHNWVEKARVVVIAPGALQYVDIAELVKKAKELGKPVVMYGALSALYKDLGIEYFCPYGLKV